MGYGEYWRNYLKVHILRNSGAFIILRKLWMQLGGMRYSLRSGVV